MPRRVSGPAAQPVAPSSPRAPARPPAGPAAWTGAPGVGARDGFERPTPSGDTTSSLAAINAVRLVNGKDSTCVATTRINLRRAGMSGLPEATGNDKNNPRGMMVQMLNSGHWESAAIPGSTPTTIRSTYGTATANVLSRDAFDEAVAQGHIPEGAVVFQTKHGWDYNKGSLGNDVGIVRDGTLHNFRRMPSLRVYGDATRDLVVLLPR